MHSSGDHPTQFKLSYNCGIGKRWCYGLRLSNPNYWNEFVAAAPIKCFDKTSFDHTKTTDFPIKARNDVLNLEFKIWCNYTSFGRKYNKFTNTVQICKPRFEHTNSGEIFKPPIRGGFLTDYVENVFIKD
ncbi:unnamed protein product [Caenorhabditis sp. 36 PRJEB53466]|nr:unnamed protein product [Caenorhabditis sp. 36 PRJEB53466]